VVEGLSKTFRIPQEHVHTLKERALHPLRRARYHEFQALDDVSFSVGRGEFFGIVGRNGSGKSTMLKCLAGIYKADSGRIVVDGRLSTFIELGVGFNPDLPAYDNIVLNGTMLGLSPREARARCAKVVEFAGLEEFAELKIKNYSSGMLVRLAFSVMIQVDADILLVDEVLAVGDAAFQRKCYEEFARIRERGSTLLLVTHDMGAVRRFCDRALLLEHGRVVEIGDSEWVGNRYLELNYFAQARAEVAQVDAAAEQVAEAGRGNEVKRLGDGSALITDAWVEDQQGVRAITIPVGEPFTFVMRVEFVHAASNPHFGFGIYNDRDNLVMGANSTGMGHTGDFAAGELVEIRVRMDAIMSPGRHDVEPFVSKQGAPDIWHDRPVRMFSVLVTGQDRVGAITSVPFDINIDRVTGGAREPVG
jgi:ABC-type polysaccharide/polyol phosphate transport system ATPase subunit